MKQSRNEFTLIELLIVIAIIAILAGMLLPALNQARNIARDLTCLSNLKQFGNAETMYHGDFQYFVPTSANSKVDPLYWYQNKLYRSYMGEKVYDAQYSNSFYRTGKLCPNAPYISSSDGKTAHVTSCYGRIFREKEVSSNPDLVGCFKESMLKRSPSQLYLITDFGASRFCPAYTYGNTPLGVWNTYKSKERTKISGLLNGGTGYPRLTHRNRVDMLYFDGHADAPPYQNMTINYSLANSPWPVDTY